MERVVRFEEKRIRRWVVAFIALALLLTVGFTWALVRFFLIVAEQHTFDVVEILWEDREVIAEYWQDTFNTVLMELPRRLIVIAVSFITLFVTIWVCTRHRRKIINRRLKELANRKKTA